MKALALLVCLAFESFAMELHKVQAPAGEIEGLIKNVEFDGTEFQVGKYLGIPYAEAPIGNLRFERPVPKKPFISTYRATGLRNICVQGDSNSLPSDKFQESEDCLFLNIYAPHTKSGGMSKKAVIVYIHGGYGKYTFVNGAANFVSGDVLSAVGDVIVVTFNYRLSLLGFFSMENEDMRGNYGLWDQHEAIKWVHRNIEAFGGDPNKITVFGEDQGAVAVILQSFYPKNFGLFRKVIAENGTPFPALRTGLSPFMAHSYPVMKTARKLGCLQEDLSSIQDCIRNISKLSLKRFVESDYDLEALTPIFDGEFILGTVENMIGYEETARVFSEVEMILGFQETRVANYLNIEQDYNSIFDQDLEEMNMHNSIIRGIILVVYGYGIPAFTEKIIMNRYTNIGDTNIEIENLKYLEHLINDVISLLPSIRTYLAHRNVSFNSNTVLYKLGLNTRHSNENRLSAGSEFTLHDRFYKFGFSNEILAAHNMSGFRPSRSDFQMSRKMMEFYTGFATDKNTIKVSSRLDPDETPSYFASHLDPNCLSIKLPIDVAENDSDVSGSIPCVVLPSGELINYNNDPSVEFWLDIVPRLIDLTRSTFSMDHGGHRFHPPDAEDDGREKDISKKEANAVIIGLGVITGLLCLCLIAMGVFVIVVKIRRTKLKSTGARQ